MSNRNRQMRNGEDHVFVWDGVSAGAVLMALTVALSCGSAAWAQEKEIVENDVPIYESDLDLDKLEQEQEQLESTASIVEDEEAGEKDSAQATEEADVPKAKPNGSLLKRWFGLGGKGGKEKEEIQAAPVEEVDQQEFNEPFMQDDEDGVMAGEEMETSPIEPMSEELLEAELTARQKAVLREDQILQINESLRRAIEQNRRLQEEKKKLDDQLRTLRGEQRLQTNRLSQMEQEVATYQDQVMRAARMQQEFDLTVRDLRAKINAREEALVERINQLHEDLERRSQPQEPENAEVIVGEDGEALPAPKDGLDVINLVDDLNQMQTQMREDEAKVHYNMGNIFFNQGKFDEALAEYEKALVLVPSDPNTHFNIAYIAGDYLHEYPRAIEHYQQYLYLNPGAGDAALVREKMIEAQLYVRSYIDREVDREVEGNRPHRLYNW